jgi:hypothetical protein
VRGGEAGVQAHGLEEQPERFVLPVFHQETY